MPKGNNRSKEDLIHRLKQIRELVDESIDLLNRNKPVPISKTDPAPSRTRRVSKDIDFSMPIRPFIKKYSTGMSGPKKFTLLIAFLAKGDATKRVPLENIKKQWNKVTAKNLLGMKFNPFYSGRAKDNDWVDTEKTSLYYLRPSWKAIFNEKH